MDICLMNVYVGSIINAYSLFESKIDVEKRKLVSCVWIRPIPCSSTKSLPTSKRPCKTTDKEQLPVKRTIAKIYILNPSSNLLLLTHCTLSLQLSIRLLLLSLFLPHIRPTHAKTRKDQHAREAREHQPNITQ